MDGQVNSSGGVVTARVLNGQAGQGQFGNH
jgi:hypothetical protein